MWKPNASHFYSEHNLRQNHEFIFAALITMNLDTSVENKSKSGNVLQALLLASGNVAKKRGWGRGPMKLPSPYWTIK